jgi:hypothetical protein
LEHARRRNRGRLELVVLELDPEPSNRRREVDTRLRRVVREKADAVTRVSKLLDCVSRAVDRPAGDVQDPVYVEENRRPWPASLFG